MNEWFKKLLETAKSLWSKWTGVQKIIFFGIVAVVLLGSILMVVFSSRSDMVPLITTPITDEEAVNRISERLDKEGIKHQVAEDGRIMVSNEKIAKQGRNILFRENLLPKGVSPWDVFQMDKWTVTDFERKVKLRQAITRNLEQHIEALDDVDSVRIILVMPEKELFTDLQEPVTASVVITPSPGSDISSNRKKIEGIERMVQFAVEGLQKENIVIIDQNSIKLNDFGPEIQNIDRLDVAKKQLDLKKKLENEYRKNVEGALQKVFSTADRYSVSKVDIELNFDKETFTKRELLPFIEKPDNPDTPFDDSIVKSSIPVSEQKSDEHYKGTGFHPEGPAGQEGQIPDAYRDMDGLQGQYDKVVNTVNYAYGEKNSNSERMPYEIKRVTIGVLVDGRYEKIYDKKGKIVETETGGIKRNYVSVTDEEIKKAQNFVATNVGFNKYRGDLVSVQHFQFDRTLQFEKEDDMHRRTQRLTLAIVYSVVALLLVILFAIMIRAIIRTRERMRRQKEEELARKQAMLREAALRRAEEESVSLHMTGEDKHKLELQESAMQMARENPEDVAHLIRTWLLEE